MHNQHRLPCVELARQFRKSNISLYNLFLFFYINIENMYNYYYFKIFFVFIRYVSRTWLVCTDLIVVQCKKYMVILG